jgi:hypothetical protein
MFQTYNIVEGDYRAQVYFSSRENFW